MHNGKGIQDNYFIKKALDKGNIICFFTFYMHYKMYWKTFNSEIIHFFVKHANKYTICKSKQLHTFSENKYVCVFCYNSNFRRSLLNSLLFHFLEVSKQFLLKFERYFNVFFPIVWRLSNYYAFFLTAKIDCSIFDSQKNIKSHTYWYNEIQWLPEIETYHCKFSYIFLL